MKFITQALKARLIQLVIANKLPKNVEDFDDRLLTPTLVGVSYTVTIVTTVKGGINYTKKYDVFLEQPYDAFAHLRDISVGLFDIGLEIKQEGSYMFKVRTEKGLVLYSIRPTVEQDTNILNNQN